MDDTLRNALRSMRCEPSPNRLRKVMQLPQFEDIVLTFEKGSDGGVDSEQFKRCFFASVISFCST